ncbi:MAG: tyrosine-type recombinase/integrase [Candidatus Micrarchaeia archaeon]
MEEEKEKGAEASLKLVNTPSESSSIQLPQFEAREEAGQLQVKRKKPDQVNQSSDFWLKQEDVLKLIGSARSLRDRCILKLLYFGMLRRNEARSLRIEDIDFPRHRLNLHITKRSKPRSVPITEPGVFDDLRLYLEKRATGWVFVSKSKDGRLSNTAINDIVGLTAQLAGIANPNPRLRKLNPHILRHSFARHLRRQSPPIAIEVLQKLLGHKSVSTTMNIYASADLDFMEEELKRCSSR